MPHTHILTLSPTYTCTHTGKWGVRGAKVDAAVKGGGAAKAGVEEAARAAVVAGAEVEEREARAVGGLVEDRPAFSGSSGLAYACGDAC